MRYQIEHVTSYEGSEPISVGHNEAWLTARATPRQRCLSHALRIVPEPSVMSTRIDYFGNQVTQFSFNKGYRRLEVRAENEVELRAAERPSGSTWPWEAVAAAVARHDWPEELAAYEFVFDSPRCRVRPEFAEYARRSFTPQRPVLEATTELMSRVYRDFQYDGTATNVTTPVEQVFRQRRGVCQDFAHLMISMLRSVGVPARYVSGYLRTIPPADGRVLVGADASHAWLSAYCGPAGWIDFDPTNDHLPEFDHVTLAWGRDYGDVAPLKGVYIGGGSLGLQVEVRVRPVSEEGRGAGVG